MAIFSSLVIIVLYDGMSYLENVTHSNINNVSVFLSSQTPTSLH